MKICFTFLPLPVFLLILLKATAIQAEIVEHACAEVVTEENSCWLLIIDESFNLLKNLVYT